MLRLAVIGDVHLVAEPTAAHGSWHNTYDFTGLADRLVQARAYLAADGVDAIALIGDLTHHGSTDHAALADTVLTLGVPVLAVSGNHDAGTLPAAATAAPVHGTRVGDVTIAGVHVAPGGWFGARLEATDAVERWNGEPVVLLSHYPLLSHAVRLSERGMPYPGDLVDRAELAGRLACREHPTVVLSGHIHARDAHADGPVLQLTQAALVEAPYEISIVDVASDHEGVLTVRRRSVTFAGPEPDGPAPLLTGEALSATYRDGAWAIRHDG